MCNVTRISSFQKQKGVNAIQRCSVENQKGAIMYKVYGDIALLVLNGTSLNGINALLRVYWKSVSFLSSHEREEEMAGVGGIAEQYMAHKNNLYNVN